jgi:hypothetical protein
MESRWLWGYGPPIGIFGQLLILVCYILFEFWPVVLAVVAVGAILLINFIQTRRKNRAAQDPEVE